MDDGVFLSALSAWQRPSMLVVARVFCDGRIEVAQGS
jgi:hypothetical protein